MTVPQVQITARNHYLSLPDPLPLNGAIAIPAVLYRESGLRPTSQGVQGTEHGGVRNRRGAYGVASWNGPQDPSQIGDPRYDRQAAYTEYCDKRGLANPAIPSSYDVLEHQLDFFLHEAANGYSLTWAAVRSAAPFAAIIRVIVEDYERPKAPEPEIADAIRIATALAAVPLPAPGAPGQLPSVPAPKLPPTVPGLPTPFPGLPPIAADAAGRITYVADCIHRAREARIAQLIAADPEVVAYDAMLAGISGLAPSAPLPPLAIPASATKGTKQVSTLPTTLPSFMINWKTTLSGAVTLVAQLAQVIPALQPYSDILNKISMLAAGSTGFFAKDSTTTGGTVAATPEAARRLANQ